MTHIRVQCAAKHIIGSTWVVWKEKIWKISVMRERSVDLWQNFRDAKYPWTTRQLVRKRHALPTWIVEYIGQIDEIGSREIAIECLNLQFLTAQSPSHLRS
jgi:hypothetical protein